MRIDCHTHAFTEKIAERVVEQLVNYYQVSTTHNGTLPELLSLAGDAQLDAIVLLAAATKPEQVKPANDWQLSLLRRGDFAPKVIPFGTYHPDDPNWLGEIARLREAGIRGIKLHPEFQGIDLADERLLSFYEEVAPDFALLIHIGDPRVSPDNFSTPTKVAAIAKRFPNMRIIAAHMGGYCMWEEALEVLAGTQVYLDTSSTLEYIDLALFQQLVQKHGAERILYGSDYPLRAPGTDLQWFEEVAWLSRSEKDLILGENCRALLSI